MISLKTAKWVREAINLPYNINEVSSDKLFLLKKQLESFNSETPDVSIIMPVWNEENNLIKTLFTIAGNLTSYKVELILVNNNSTDNTQEIIDKLGVKNFLETEQSISKARQKAFINCKGKYILSADGDSLYPINWIEKMVRPLQNDKISCTYGNYSFIPDKNFPRRTLFLYEIITKILFVIRKLRREYLNVMGFNFAFRKEDAQKFGGFNTSRKRWSDGWMALELMKYGKLKNINSTVWTGPRRLKADGTFLNAFKKRMRKEFSNIAEYFLPLSVKKY